jgi:hypothetical protein
VIPSTIFLLKVARARLHGFSEREISIVRSLMMSEIESAYLERDQMQSTNLRDEFLQVLTILSLNTTPVFVCRISFCCMPDILFLSRFSQVSCVL